MKRVYERATVTPGDGGMGVALDGRPVRTPGRAPLVLPSAALAEAVAGEWNDQGERVDPRAMPLMQLAATAIDRVRPARAAIVDEVARYAETDLVCYRADRPAELAARQQAAWDPVLDWLAGRYRARLIPVVGILAKPQDPDALAALRAAVAGEDDFALTGLATAAGALGSLALALGLRDGAFAPEEAHGLSRLDETYQSERWGADAEAEAAAHAQAEEMRAVARFFALLAEATEARA